MIAPAVYAFRPEGLAAKGSSPAGTLFPTQARPRYDATFPVDHDRAPEPIRTFLFGGAVKVASGLPIVRISPDLGTTLDAAQLGAGAPCP